MIIDTPNKDFKFTVREDSNEHCDEAVVRETWLENVYQLNEDLTNNIVIDIGANIGAVSIYCASKGARVIAVEPEPDNLKYLKLNAENNNVRIEIMPVAVADKFDSMRISERQGNSKLNKKTGTVVDVIPLEEVFKRKNIAECSVLKVDIEGAEYAMIDGASIETLNRIRYITLEFDSADEKTFGKMLYKLAKVFNLHIIGSPDRGGYIYGHRY